MRRLLKGCLEAIERHTSYAQRELVIVQHRTGDIAAMDRLLNDYACTRVPYSGPFNFAAMNNLGARRATGDVLVFMNDDVEPVESGWLTAMLLHANRREVAAVGAKLVYPSGRDPARRDCDRHHGGRRPPASQHLRIAVLELAAFHPQCQRRNRRLPRHPEDGI